jgi:hypothetical protein
MKKTTKKPAQTVKTYRDLVIVGVYDVDPARKPEAALVDDPDDAGAWKALVERARIPDLLRQLKVDASALAGAPEPWSGRRFGNASGSVTMTHGTIHGVDGFRKLSGSKVI